ncbi:Gfo/Idh/MocA family protein [Micromonospora sagamiensis]|uniref:Putative dehydrogenase n=1 Tax=Micromonospora sagamiensis TaxID=47875 RepID=A0A562WH77_9ACTN|nr:Gfo/Idh/MocA family oxidoreductase [Micromonospora sagamiensis]TWJ29498.1 putative dehydrogenase [Micromonospora sagamiensis]BCL17474.1 hypothetical protein GCM10017556_52130 [Micromonospora sagamiensis]
MTTAPVRVGLVGAGTWAARMHAPMLAAGPETVLSGVWSRRGDAAGALAAAHGVPAAPTFADLLRECEAVAFAVPPDIQAALAVQAARAGRAVLLEKPIALDLDAARRLADVVGESGVVSQVVFTKRYHARTRAFLAAAGGFDADGGRACYLHGGFLGGEFATGWRLTHGGLFDLGPHLLDLLDATLGPIVDVRAAGRRSRWTELTCTHRGGAVSQASLSGSVALPRVTTTVELFGPAGRLAYDTAGMDHDECWPVVRAEFAAAVRAGRPHPLDVHRGLMIQELLARAAADPALRD